MTDTEANEGFDSRKPYHVNISSPLQNKRRMKQTNMPEEQQQHTVK